MVSYILSLYYNFEYFKAYCLVTTSFLYSSKGITGVKVIGPRISIFAYKMYLTMPAGRVAKSHASLLHIARSKSKKFASFQDIDLKINNNNNYAFKSMLCHY